MSVGEKWGKSIQDWVTRQDPIAILVLTILIFVLWTFYLLGLIWRIVRKCRPNPQNQRAEWRRLADDGMDLEHNDYYHSDGLYDDHSGRPISYSKQKQKEAERKAYAQPHVYPPVPQQNIVLNDTDMVMLGVSQAPRYPIDPIAYASANHNVPAYTRAPQYVEETMKAATTATPRSSSNTLVDDYFLDKSKLAGDFGNDHAVVGPLTAANLESKKPPMNTQAIQTTSPESVVCNVAPIDPPPSVSSRPVSSTTAFSQTTRPISAGSASTSRLIPTSSNSRPLSAASGSSGSATLTNIQLKTDPSKNSFSLPTSIVSSKTVGSATPQLPRLSQLFSFPKPETPAPKPIDTANTNARARPISQVPDISRPPSPARSTISTWWGLTQDKLFSGGSVISVGSNPGISNSKLPKHVSFDADAASASRSGLPEAKPITKTEKLANVAAWTESSFKATILPPGAAGTLPGPATLKKAPSPLSQSTSSPSGPSPRRLNAPRSPTSQPNSAPSNPSSGFSATPSLPSQPTNAPSRASPGLLSVSPSRDALLSPSTPAGRSTLSTGDTTVVATPSPTKDKDKDKDKDKTKDVTEYED